MADEKSPEQRYTELQHCLWKSYDLQRRYIRDAKREKTRAQLWEGKASILRHENNALRRQVHALKQENARLKGEAS